MRIFYIFVSQFVDFAVTLLCETGLRTPARTEYHCHAEICVFGITMCPVIPCLAILISFIIFALLDFFHPSEQDQRGQAAQFL